MSTTWYKASFGRIEPVEVLSVTGHYLVLKDTPSKRDRIIGHEISYHRTWADAHKWIIDHAQKRLGLAEVEYEHASQALIRAQSLHAQPCRTTTPAKA